MIKESKNLKGNNEINLTDYAKGIYSIVVKTNGNYKTIKMVIE